MPSINEGVQQVVTEKIEQAGHHPVQAFESIKVTPQDTTAPEDQSGPNTAVDGERHAYEPANVTVEDYLQEGAGDNKDDATNKAENMADQAGEKAQELKNKASDKAQELKNEARDQAEGEEDSTTYDNVKETVSEKLNQAGNAASNVFESVKETVQDAVAPEDNSEKTEESK
eukprot:CAMPEP_0184547988 /NCGR_PEP_ID=MMETSP0199_2-20130426/5929_1 /TAXON_ID=1112570 /ORGANISM="Thraustochytrium sp., Strain LLF1b" /LENGTH=171 /DNA_ID=CAMNT_0026942553 /DNA_START=100 /DNA_END=615 /DNA_ORIENTATION=+